VVAPIAGTDWVGSDGNCLLNQVSCASSNAVRDEPNGSPELPTLHVRSSARRAAEGGPEPLVSHDRAPPANTCRMVPTDGAKK
jgi:hypothetical protein